MQELMTKATIEELVDYRNRAVAGYTDAFNEIMDADNALKEARKIWALACGGNFGGYIGSDTQEVREFMGAVSLPDRDRYFRTAARLIDISCWRHVVERTNLTAMMDRQARDEFEKGLRWVPERFQYKNGDCYELTNPDELYGMPPFTVENIYATIERFAGEAGMIFRRGIANAFSQLDRRFRSHDGFKVGHRVVLTHAFDGTFGSFTSYGNTAATIRDIERTFLVLDGKAPRDDYAGILGQVAHERRGKYGPHQSEHDGDYFKLRAFKNGNAHLWFTRDDLLVQVNKLLAEYYGEVIGDAHTEGYEEDPLENRKMTPARFFGFFPTPDKVVAALYDKLPLRFAQGEPVARVLEPSAGTGQLAREAATRGALVDCVEVQPHLVDGLRQSNLYNKVFMSDFLKLKFGQEYDAVIMNPPFDRERDIDHVTHALKCLKPGGVLLAIMSAGTEFRTTKKSVAFQALMTRMNGRFFDLPAGSFSDQGTNVNTVILRVYADGRRQPKY